MRAVHASARRFCSEFLGASLAVLRLVLAARIADSAAMLYTPRYAARVHQFSFTLEPSAVVLMTTARSSVERTNSHLATRLEFLLGGRGL